MKKRKGGEREKRAGGLFQGSITIYMALILCLLLSLVSAGLQSVRLQAARTQILAAMDVGLYSLFSEYDRTLLEKYDIFALDCSGGDGLLEMAPYYDDFEGYMDTVLHQGNSQSLFITQGGFSGYALLTDEEGGVFFHQVVQYMKDTIWAQGVMAAASRLSAQEQVTVDAEAIGEEAESRGTLSQYEEELSDAAQKSQEERKRLEKEAEEKGLVIVDPPTKDVVNPIPMIKRIRQMGVLALVLPAGASLSDVSLGDANFPSHRQNQEGMALEGWYQREAGLFDDALFQQYIIKKLGNYLHPSDTGMNYQVEYILGRQMTDRENLEHVAGRLLLIREGINAAAIASDPIKMEQAAGLSMAIASSFLIPPAASVIQAALVLSWAFGESVLDVRELFDGGRVPLIKTAESWQLSLENLPELLDHLDSDRKSDPLGLSYEDYLGVLLLGKSRQEKTMGTLDMIEQSLRGMDGWSNFRLDSCVVAIRASADVLADGTMPYSVEKIYGYH